MSQSDEFPLIVITGMSGAGKTVAMQSLEDLGYFCIDNLPPVLLAKFADLLKQSKEKQKLKKIALVIDLRGREFFSSLWEALKNLEDEYGIKVRILFLEANDETLVRRYKETRRRHPLSPDGTPLDGIRQERILLSELREKAHNVIDTSHLRPIELKEKVAQLMAQPYAQSMSITFMSFGYKHGIPIDADLIFDVRFLPNPHYIESLRLRTGKDKEVAEYVLKCSDAQEFLQKIEDLLTFLIPNYKKEGKTQLVVGIGCTGGRHRSVAIAEYFYDTFKEYKNCRVIHRDIQKGG